MGEWTIDPTGKTATLTVEGNNAKVSVSENTGSSINYTVKFRQGDYCGEYTFTQEGTTPPEPQGETVYINVKFVNPLGEDAYIIGNGRMAFLQPNPDLIPIYGTWGEIDFRYKYPKDKCSSITIPANGEIVIPYKDLTFLVPRGKEGETPSIYNGGSFYKHEDGTPVYWETNSWTRNAADEVKKDNRVIEYKKDDAHVPQYFNTGTTSNHETITFTINKLHNKPGEQGFEGEFVVCPET